MDYNARFYDPLLGRFTSPDSMIPDPGSVIGYNRYAYVANSPMVFSDPSGHCYTSSGAWIPGGGDGACSFRTSMPEPAIRVAPISGYSYVEDNPYLLQENDNDIKTVDIGDTGWSYYSEYSNMWIYDFGDQSHRVGLDMERNSTSQLYTALKFIPTASLLVTAAYKPDASIFILWIMQQYINHGRETLEAQSTRFDDPCKFTGSVIANTSYPPDGDPNIIHPITVVVIDNAYHTDGIRISSTLVIVQNQDTGEAQIIDMSPAYLPEILRELNKRD